MPCNSDYLNATAREVEHRRAATLYAYALRATEAERAQREALRKQAASKLSPAELRALTGEEGVR